MNWVTYEGQLPVNLALVLTFSTARDCAQPCIEFVYAADRSVFWRFSSEALRDKAYKDLLMWITE